MVAQGTVAQPPSSGVQLFAQLCAPPQLTTHSEPQPVISQWSAPMQFSAHPPPGQSSTQLGVSMQLVWQPPPAQWCTQSVAPSHVI
jgi:hypothetical protein